MKALLWKWVVDAFEVVLGFFKDSTGKYSSKRLISVAFAIVAIRQFVIGDWFGGLMLAAAAVVLMAVAAFTVT